MCASQSGFAVLVVDDDPRVARMHAMILSSAGYRVLVALDADTALGLAERHDVDLVLSDYEMHPANGLDLFERLRDRGVRCPFVIISGSIGVEEHAAARGLTVTAILEKPLAPEALRAAIAEILSDPGSGPTP